MTPITLAVLLPEPQGIPTWCRKCGAWMQADVTDAMALAEYVVLGARCPACIKAGAQEDSRCYGSKSNSSESEPRQE